MERISLTAFFPAYNDEHTIEKIVRTAAEEVRRVTDDLPWKVWLEKRSTMQSSLPEVSNSLRWVIPARVITLNSQQSTLDNEHSNLEIHNLLAQLQLNIDLVNGYKVKRSDAWYRVWIGATYRRVMRWAFHLSLRDVDCDFRVLRRHVFDAITLESQSGVICVEMARKFDDAGFRMTEIPVSHYPRMHGRSEFFRIRHISHTLRGLLRVWWSLVVARRLPVWMTTAAKKS